MPLTVPDIIQQYARAGGSLAFLLDIEPSVVDSWTAKRFATAAVEVAGEAYADATLGGLDRIGYEAKIIQGGTVATLPDVTCTLINKDRLNETLISDNIEGRQAVVQMTAISPNVCLNSSFEKRDGDDFENWAEHPAGSGSSISAETGTVYDSATACKIESIDAVSGSYITSDVMTWRIGSKVVVSVYARTLAGTATVSAAINVNTIRWYNGTTKVFGMGRVKNVLGVATSTAWQRFTLEMDWSRWLSQYGTGTAALSDQLFYVEIWSEPSETVVVDAVQVELNQQVTPYQHNRYELDGGDVMTVFTGIVKNPSWSASGISLTLEAWESNRHRDIPKTILTAATDATWTVPKDSLGKPFPMTYGDFSSGGLTVWNPYAAGLYEFARGLLVNLNPNATGGILIYFDRPGMKLYAPGGGVYRLYHFCEDDGRFYEQMNYDDPGYGYDAQEWVEDFAAHPRWKSNTNCYWQKRQVAPFMAYLRARSIWNSLYWINPEYMVDDDLTAGALGECGMTPPPTCYLIFEPFPFDADVVMKSANDDVKIFVLGDFTCEAAPSGITTLTSTVISRGEYIEGLLDVNVFDGITTAESWRNTPRKRGGGDPAADKLLTQIQFPITDWESFSACFPIDCIACWLAYSAGNSADVHVYSMGILIYIMRDLETAAFASQLYGRTFGTTWDSRKTATDLVESAPEVIESIIREELDAVDADIAMTMFDAADTARPQAAAGQLHETKNSMDVIAGICKDFGLLYYIDTVGKHSLINLDWRAVDKHLFLRDWYKPFESVKVSYTPRAEIVNDLILHYDRIQFTDEYRRLAYCNRGGRSGTIGAAYQTKCAASYAELGNKVQALELSCDWIKADATAEAMVQWTIDWLYMQRMLVSGDLFMNCIDLALGDIVTLDIEPLLPESFTETARFMVMSLVVNRKNSRVSVKLLEVKEP